MADAVSDGEGRVLAALRNIHAGVLLLFKARLAALSPTGSDEVLIKTRLKAQRGPGGAIAFVGSGKKTVDVQQIKDRFSDLSITVDWKRFDRMTEHRNDVEHYYTKVSDDALREVIADAHIVIRDFVVKELGEDPRSLLGSETWQAMLLAADVFRKEQEECLLALTSIGWSSPTLLAAVQAHHCAVCGSPLLLPVAGWTDKNDVDVECRFCGDVQCFDEYAEAALDGSLGASNYESVKDGGEPSLVQCPECLKDGFVVQERGCALCDYEPSYTECLRCGGPVGLDEQDLGGACAYCDHLTHKDD